MFNIGEADDNQGYVHDLRWEGKFSFKWQLEDGIILICVRFRKKRKQIYIISLSNFMNGRDYKKAFNLHVLSVSEKIRGRNIIFQLKSYPSDNSNSTFELLVFNDWLLLSGLI